METEEFFQQFRIDRTSKVPLKTQLEQALEAAFARLEPGSTIPPERQIAEALQISRVTVRSALKTFFDRGKIVRHRRLGTRIAGQTHTEFNPLSFGSGFAETPDYPIRFLLYEDLPVQKAYWEKGTELFNRDRKNGRVELVYLSAKQDIRHIAEIIESESIDLLMVSSAMPLNFREQLRPLPESILKKYQSDEFLFSRMQPEYREMMRYQMPLCVIFPQLYWNADMAEKPHFPELRNILRQGQHDFLLKAAAKMPDGIPAGTRLWDYFAMTNLPEILNDRDRLKCGLQEIAELGRKAGKNREKLFVTTQKYMLEETEQFVKGNRLTLMAYPHQIHCFPKPSFRMGVLPVPKRAGEKRLSFTVNLALTSNLMDSHTAEAFLHFLLSPEIQELGGQLREDCPVRKAEAIAYLERNQFTESGKTEVFLKQLSFSTGNDKAKKIQDFIVYFFREELQDLLEGKSSVEEILKLFEQKWKNYQKRTGI